MLPESYVKKSFLQLFLMIINSFIDLLGLAAIIPLLAALLKKGFIHEQPVLNSLYENLGFTDDKWFIVFICLIVFIIIIVKNLFGLWVNKRQMHFSGNIYEYLSGRMYINTFQRGLDYFNNENSNKIQNRIVRIPNAFSGVISVGIFQFLNELIVLILIIISITLYDPKIIVLLAATIVPVFFLFYKFNGEKIKGLRRKMNDLQPKIAKPVYELSFGYVDVAISGVFETFKKEFSRYVKQMKVEQVRVSVLSLVPTRLVEVCVISTVILILIYGVFVLQEVEKIVTLLGVFGLAAYRIVPSVNRLMMALINVKGGEYSIDIIEKFLLKGESTTNDNVDDLKFEDRISISDLGFKFKKSESWLLNNLDLDIQKGESIGIVGRSGSGKTTLMNILLGFIKPVEGSISVDGVKLDDQNITAWQKIVGYVRQDVFLVDGSIAENIAFGVEKEQINDAQIQEAIKTASLEEFMDTLPDGVDTQIGERGAKISGGQRQRIGIARAIYHGAQVLFFDEATSALDEKTEKEITEAIKSLKEQKLTMVIIAHRLSSLKYCDKIYRVESGGIHLESK